MKRIFVCLVPFLAVNISGMGFFGGSDEKHEKLIDSIYADGLKSLAIPDKKRIKFDNWEKVFGSALKYAKDKDSGLRENDFASIRQASTGLKELFKKFDKTVIDDAKRYVQGIGELYNTYVQKAAEIKSSKTTAKEKRYAQEALAALVNVMQLAALDLQQDFLDVARAQAALEKQVSETTGKVVELAKSADDFRKNAQRLKDKSLRPSAFDKYLQRFTEKRFIETSADKQFNLLVKRIADIGDDVTFGDVLHDVHEYAKKQNMDAYTANSMLNAENAERKDENAALAAAEKIAKSLFTSRSKRYPYELYAKLWNKALVLKAQGKIKAKA